MSRIHLEPAYILHSRSFRETSLIVEAFTREHGRVAVVARGASPPVPVGGMSCKHSGLYCSVGIKKAIWVR